ncbi:hypothetical protein GUITHDRAFT_103363 [Guillardia theta CCMP2712]|uniref:Hexosyltransferase n=1 Tax=Guillardia theta (strain CCMP2712) TaxID=905079 RepID=L1JRT0_GUITC|nr:hypothetical protein GUITHDRAFT_103363 [Guillardia theta CCMP2712]EKX50773.1 hypothetical protein GUITHDRAFT_103363 [Guillardia theta CCMP2712]|eukprot:XP_005837753.1 hypothetical protein GUITHDRAFT_103363 [Guillardia theta CCMP2712]
MQSRRICVLMLATLALCFPLYLCLIIPLYRPHVKSTVSKDRGAAGSAARTRLVVSVSSLLGRVDYLRRSLPSIEKQSLRPDRIVVNMPLYTRFGNITAGDVESLVAALGSTTGPLEKVKGKRHDYANRLYYLHFLDRDFGPATKLLGALQVEKDPETLVVTLDDDCEYSPEVLAALRYHMPAEGSLSGLCQELPPLMPIHGMVTLGFPHGILAKAGWYAEDRIIPCYGWLMGYTGIAYRVRYFGSDIFEYLQKLPSGCFFHDDVWLSGYLYKKGIQRFYYPFVPDPMHFSRHPNMSISSISDTQSRHQLPCVEYFNRFGWN